MMLVMPRDLSRKQLVGLCPAADRFHREERGKAFLPETKLALDLALRLGIFGNQMTDSEAAEGALELGERVGVAGLARFVAEEAQAVGVEVVGKAMGKENVPDMGKVGEGGFGLDEARPDDETGGIVDGQGEDLEPFPGPPLVRRAVVLEKIAIALALPSAAGFGAAFGRLVQQIGHVLEDMVADIGNGAFEGEAAEEFVGKETEVGGFTGGEGGAQERLRFIRPGSGVVASGWRERETAVSGQPEGPQGVEARSANSEPGTGTVRRQVPVVESGEGCFDEFERQSVEQLFVFIRALKSHPPLANQRLWGAAPNPGVYRIGANGSGESVLAPERGDPSWEPIAPSGLLGLLSSRALSVPAVGRTRNIKCGDARTIDQAVK